MAVEGSAFKEDLFPCTLKCAVLGVIHLREKQEGRSTPNEVCSSEVGLGDHFVDLECLPLALWGD